MSIDTTISCDRCGATRTPTDYEQWVLDNDGRLPDGWGYGPRESVLCPRDAKMWAETLAAIKAATDAAYSKAADALLGRAPP